MEKENRMGNNFNKEDIDSRLRGNDKENNGNDKMRGASESFIKPEKSSGNPKKIILKKILRMAVLFIAFFAAWIGIVQYMAADKYEAVVKVIEEGGKVGVNPSTDKLDYGDLPKGNASTRFITIENNGAMSIYVIVIKTGDIGELIKLNRNNFELKPNEKEKLELSLSLPISADKEEYKGKVIVFKIPMLF